MGIKTRLSSLARRSSSTALGALAFAVGVGLVVYMLQRSTPAGTQQLGDVGETPLLPTSCQLPLLVSDLRMAFREGSPAAQRYIRDILVDTAAAASLNDLQSLMVQEQDARVLEVLSQEVIARSHTLQRAGDSTELQPLLERLKTENSPELRAALIRPLEATLEPVKGLYSDLIRDPSPEARKAVAEVVVADEKLSHGNIQEFAERAISVAVAAQEVDPDAGAKILEREDIKTASEEAISSLLTLLEVKNSRLRGAAAITLGTVSAAQAERTTNALVARYQIEPDRTVRSNILQAIVHIGFSRALPILESLRNIDTALSREIDLWLLALEENWQEWVYLLQAKERIAHAQG